MKLSERQAQYLVALLVSSLEKDVANYLCYGYDARKDMADEILQQQSTELVELDTGVKE